MKQSKIKVAVTGGIGSGKSTVCKIITEAGFPVYSCDAIYTDLFNRGVFTEKIIFEFGKNILNGSGSIDKKKLAKEVFSDGKKLKKLNAITHPVIFSEMFKQSEKNQGLVFFEVPVLFEGGYQNLFDEIIVTVRDKDKRVEGLMHRDGLSAEEVNSRIKRQFDYNNSDFTQYYVIHNDCNLSTLCDIIDDLLLKMAQKYSI